MCFILFGSYILGATLSDDEALLDAGASALPRVVTGEGDMGENAAATPAKARTRIVRRICYVTMRCYAWCSLCCVVIAWQWQEQDHDPH
jgi:hypothetical protein